MKNVYLLILMFKALFAFYSHALMCPFDFNVKLRMKPELIIEFFTQQKKSSACLKESK